MPAYRNPGLSLMIKGGLGPKTPRASAQFKMANTNNDIIQCITDVPYYNEVLVLYGQARNKTHQECIKKAGEQANFHAALSERSGGAPRARINKGILSTAYDPTKWKKQSKSKTGKTRKLTGKQSAANEKRAYFFRLASKRGARKGKKQSRILVSKGNKPARIGSKVKGVEGDRPLTKAAATIRNRSRSAKGAIAAGFLQSARRLGLKTSRGPKDAKPTPGGTAAKSKGVANQMTAYSVNKVLGSYQVGKSVMIRAMKKALFSKGEKKKDQGMLQFAEESMEADIKKAKEKAKGKRRRR